MAIFEASVPPRSGWLNMDSAQNALPMASP